MIVGPHSTKLPQSCGTKSDQLGALADFLDAVMLYSCLTFVETILLLRTSSLFGSPSQGQ